MWFDLEMPDSPLSAPFVGMVECRTLENLVSATKCQLDSTIGLRSAGFLSDFCPHPRMPGTVPGKYLLNRLE